MHNTSTYRFMVAILGDDGAKALTKAGERSEVLASALLPRSIISWLAFASQYGYEGQVPGHNDSYLLFQKSINGSFDGLITIKGETFEFADSSLLHLAATVAVALGADVNVVHPSLKDTDLAALGKNIDLLVQARYLSLLKKNKEETTESSESTVEKIEAPQSPQAPEVAGHQTEPASKKSTGQKLPSLKVTKSQAAMECDVCGDSLFKNDLFKGCFCTRDLTEFAKSEVTPDGYLITFGKQWTSVDISILLDIIGGPNGQ